MNWVILEKGQEDKLKGAAQIPTDNGETKPVNYPSSSKKPKNWDKIDKDIEKEMALEKPEGEAALNSLFKSIYDKSDEATRRAMIKSY